MPAYSTFAGAKAGACGRHPSHSTQPLRQKPDANPAFARLVSSLVSSLAGGR